MLTIHLENDSLYLYGTPEASAGTEIRGCLEIYFNEPTRVNSITLRFFGILKLQWEEGSSNITHHRRQCKIKKTLIQHDWTFLSARKWPYTMEAHKTYRYPFDLVLPGNMPESITTSTGGNYGSLSYDFKATVTRPLAAKNLVLYRPIQVIRQQEPCRTLFPRYNMVINNTYGEKVNYRIQLEKSIYQRGQPIRIHFKFVPLDQGLRIRHVSCFLKEYVTLIHSIEHISSIHPSSSCTRQQSRIISLTRDDHFPCRGQEWKKMETLVIPRSTQAVQFDLDHPLLKIEHKLRFTICFIQPHGQLSELRVTMPIRLSATTDDVSDSRIRSTMANNTTTMTAPYRFSSDDLPRYEDACLLAPYEPYQQQWYSPPSPVPSLPALVHCNNNHSSFPYDGNNDDDDIIDDTGDWHQQHLTTPLDQPIATHDIACVPSSGDYFSYQPCQPLQRVPSYDTAIRTPY
ncbi:uncharacterized protein BX664DRAFT_326641 [Halteromyces radiatus]|uniref:uncharacterized protein n=1 Tax=Halteromyces radiatus TaxID=101107 RepID=UPI00221FBC77|nr:uncharacterized protein BX664DRAFT_326641 [Halteromyces radiatus]KAI8097543.1 hypothetical protein BX664DRAFT_326641 [Halteromyces radiatus]